MNFYLHVCSDSISRCNPCIYHVSFYFFSASFYLVTERRSHLEIPSLEIGVGVRDSPLHTCPWPAFFSNTLTRPLTPVWRRAKWSHHDGSTLEVIGSESLFAISNLMMKIGVLQIGLLKRINELRGTTGHISFHEYPRSSMTLFSPPPRPPKKSMCLVGKQQALHRGGVRQRTSGQRVRGSWTMDSRSEEVK